MLGAGQTASKVCVPRRKMPWGHSGLASLGDNSVMVLKVRWQRAWEVGISFSPSCDVPQRDVWRGCLWRMSCSFRYFIPADTSSLKSCRNLKSELQLQGYGRRILKQQTSNPNDLCHPPVCSSALPSPWGRSVRAVSSWRMGAGSRSSCPRVGYGTRRSVLPQQPRRWGWVCCIMRKSLSWAGCKVLGQVREQQPHSSLLVVQAVMDAACLWRLSCHFGHPAGLG